MEWTAHELLDLLQEREECQRIEAKEARNALGKSALETISAFSNEPDLGGGYLVLGLKYHENETSGNSYTIEGVSSPDKVQRELAGVCRDSFNVRITPRIHIESIRGRTIIVAFIPEAFCKSKPVYIESRGIERGSFRRIGSADFLCTQEDLDLLYQLRSQRCYESEVLPNVSWDDISSEAITVYRRMRALIDPNAEELKLDDREILLSLRSAVTQNGSVLPTIGGLLLFGSKSALRREFPLSSRVDYIVVEGLEWVPSGTNRYKLAIDFRESLVTLMPKLHTQIMGDLPNAFGLDENQLQRVDTPQIPRDVIREAVANALMHRDYREHQPTQIIRYSNRLEFRNAGYSLKPIEELGEPGSKSRNPSISNVFRDLQHAEMKGTGLRSMKRRMQEAGLQTPPIVESDRVKNKFDLILMPHHLLTSRTLSWLAHFKELELTDSQLRALAFVKEVGAITNSDYRQLNGVDTLTASSALRNLRDQGLLHSKGKGNGTYYVLGKEASSVGKEASSVGKEASSVGKEASSVDKDAVQLPPGFPSLPPSLKSKLSGLEARSVELEKITEIIRSLCSLGPLTGDELAAILGRNARHLRKNYLARMVLSGELEYLFPSNPTHPKQAYRAPSKVAKSEISK